MIKRLTVFIIIAAAAAGTMAQKVELTTGWKMKRISDTELTGEELTLNYRTDATWTTAVVPGTVLANFISAGNVPDPFIGMGNSMIPDISEVGRDYYSYWFHNTFTMQEVPADQRIWLELRGVNYFSDVFLNGHRINSETHEGMFLRQRYNVTRYIIPGGQNILAVAVWPPDPAGIPNGGQGGDGTIARNVTMQFTAGWDWIEPVADRNTGIWDKVTIEITGPVDLRNPMVRTVVKGVREPGGIQEPADVIFSAELENTSGSVIEGELGVQMMEGKTTGKIKLEPGEKRTVVLKPLRIKQPKLWWPNGMGNQSIYEARVFFISDKENYSDVEQVKFGIREFTSEFDEKTGGRIFFVNGQKVFIRGGNWIASDAFLRLSPERYDNEVKMHASMNMNMIRVWGGSITERPEFYEACDKYGLMVWQDLWITGDCNGRWVDQKKADNQKVRRNYPDNHNLFIRSAADQVKMLRNHPSLVIWCGGNEFPPPDGINEVLRDSLFPLLDPDRFYLSESTGSELMKNPYGGTGDGPYNVMEPSWFFTFRSFPFNAEIGSVGLPETESLERILSPSATIVPDEKNLHPEWTYHKYIGYRDFPARYGEVKGFSDFVLKAQMVNYEQYRSLQEGQNARMWEWYTGMLVWKNQNPWTSLRGQFYDVWLRQNAAYYGYRHAAKPFHVQINLDDTTLCVVNSSPRERRDNIIQYTVFDLLGKPLASFDTLMAVSPGTVIRLGKIPLPSEKGRVVFVKLSMHNKTTGLVTDENTYWLSTSNSDYTQMASLPESVLQVESHRVSSTSIDFTVTNTGKVPAVFTRLFIADVMTGNELLPVYYEDNYFTLMPGEKKFIRADIGAVSSQTENKPLTVKWYGYNVAPASAIF